MVGPNSVPYPAHFLQSFTESFPIVNRAVLIPCASSGIGFELARCFACDDYRLALYKKKAPFPMWKWGF